MKERLDKIIASQTSMSRADVKRAVKAGRVSVDGLVVSASDIKIDGEVNEIVLDGKRLNFCRFVYIMLNKPAGYVSASRDGREPTVVELAPQEYRSRALFPAGRLDKDTTGFILLTDDGDFAHKILSPKNHIDKTYIVTLQREVSPEELKQITDGMLLGEEHFLPASLKKIEGLTYEIVLREGKYHQIKRMFASQGNAVLALKRMKMGRLPLDESLSEGETRLLTEAELKLIEQKED